jgi:hypothetical protein
MAAAAGGAKHVVFDGTLSCALPEIPPGGTGTHEVGAIFLAEGAFAFRGAVQADVRHVVIAGHAGSEGRVGRGDEAGGGQEMEGEVEVETRMWMSEAVGVQVGAQGEW